MRLAHGPFATGVGSLPFIDEDAVRSLLALFPDVPFWPELPRVDRDDALVRRPFAGLLEPGGASEAVLRVPLASVDRAAFRVGPGFVFFNAALARGNPVLAKIQLAGPATLGSCVRDRDDRPLGTTPEGRAVVVERVVACASLLVSLLARATLPVLVVLDEPGLAAPSPELALAVARLRERGRAVGVHDCGPGFRHALAAGPDLVSFDLGALTLPGQAGDDPLAAFVRAGGAIAWGAVPTDRLQASFDPRRVAGRIREAAERLAGGPEEGRALLARSLVTPACGTALLGTEDALAVHRQALEVARLLRDERTH